MSAFHQGLGTAPGALTPRDSMETKLVVFLKYLPQLQAAGVTSIEIDGIKAALRPLALAPEATAPGPANPNPRDPVTFGFAPGTVMPTLKGRNG